MADVFISYARSTAKLARAATEALSKDGFSVWIDEELPASRAYADVISERLDEAKAVLVLWSSEAAGSHWVRSEANRGREKGTLVQASTDGTMPPMPFDQIQYADLRGWRGNANAPAWRKLSANIAELVTPCDLAASPSSPSAPAPNQGFKRRHVITGAAALALAGGTGIYALTLLGGDELPAEAELLLQKAFAIMQDGRPAEQNQAIVYLTEATRIAPDFPRAWGSLALTYALRKYQVPTAARAGEDARCRSAAETALGLDDNEPFALCALILLTPTYRNWRKIEWRGRELAKRISGIPLVFHIHADVLVDVGRNSESLAIYDRIDRKRFLIPLSERSIIQAMWNAGQLQAAEERLAEAVARWPQHYAIWTLHTGFLTHTGRAAEAVRTLEDSATRPLGYPDTQLNCALAAARAAAGSLSPGEAIRTNLENLRAGSPEVLTYLNRKVSLAQVVAQRCAFLGDIDAAFAILTGYYFGEGPWANVAPPAGNMDRSTFPLFEPPMSRLWRDRRFAALTRRIGLDHYWKENQSAPDFRQA